MKGIITGISMVLLLSVLSGCNKQTEVFLSSANVDDRTVFGLEWLSGELEKSGFSVKMEDPPEMEDYSLHVLVGLISDSLIIQKCIGSGIQPGLSGKEAYEIHMVDNEVLIIGSDHSGSLYGCVELAERILREGGLPATLSITGKPDMVVRGTCVGLQKTEYLPGRRVYEYPYTPENFPWFYDRELWIDYLDLMLANRYNSLFLWNGHPFASLVRLEDYPYAVEVDDDTFLKNEEIFTFLTTEAGKRGITVIQMFYNIILSKPFAEEHGLITQDRSRPITPLIADYTRKSVAAFIEKYPNVGLLVTLGEAMNTVEDDIAWFTETIIPGVRDGLAVLGRTDEPPIFLRGHDTDPERVMNAALPVYSNLYTTFKYNGESLTTYEPRDSWASVHKSLSELGSVHISNVHILANLEPFRYGSPAFIHKSINAMHNIQGANGLHLYPQASYWDWPYAADNVPGRLLQIERDWVWYKAWGRYAWSRDRLAEEESNFWAGEFDRFYGCDEYGGLITEAYDQAGEIAPKLLRRFGISDGNRQTLLLGMFMSQLVNPYKWRVYDSFLSSNGPEGEILVDYARKEWLGIPHQGETPPQIVKEVLDHAEKAVLAIESVKPYVRENREEFERLENDIYCYRDIALFFAHKVESAMKVLRYRYSQDLADLESAIPDLEASVNVYRDLARRAGSHYLYANSMQTQQRRVPITGRDGKNKTWEELLVHYEEELENFKRSVQMLNAAGGQSITQSYPLLEPVEVDLLDEGIGSYSLTGHERIYSDREFIIDSIAPELMNMSGLRLSYRKQIEEGTVLKFRNDVPVKVLVGYFNGHSYSILDPPSLETDAAANDRGQADIRIANALRIPGLHPVNINTYYFEAGENTLTLGKGIALVLGFMDGNQEIRTHDAGISSNADGALPVDWLFY